MLHDLSDVMIVLGCVLMDDLRHWNCYQKWYFVNWHDFKSHYHISVFVEISSDSCS